MMHLLSERCTGYHAASTVRTVYWLSWYIYCPNGVLIIMIHLLSEWWTGYHDTSTVRTVYLLSWYIYCQDVVPVIVIHLLSEQCTGYHDTSTVRTVHWLSWHSYCPNGSLVIMIHLLSERFTGYHDTSTVRTVYRLSWYIYCPNGVLVITPDSYSAGSIFESTCRPTNLTDSDTIHWVSSGWCFDRSRDRLFPVHSRVLPFDALYETSAINKFWEDLLTDTFQILYVSILCVYVCVYIIQNTVLVYIKIHRLHVSATSAIIRPFWCLPT
jgi:hypothetical protein